MSHPSHDPHPAGKPANAIAVSNVNIGLPLTLILMFVYAGFIGLGTSPRRCWQNRSLRVAPPLGLSPTACSSSLSASRYRGFTS